MDKTEEKILSAAKKVFIRKGLDGARMQEIADEAGINKALLHYYFRSKMNLFEVVFKNIIIEFVPSIGKILKSNISIEEKIERSISNYFDLLLNNPYIPIFIIGEINRDTDKFIKFVNDISGVNNIVHEYYVSFINSGVTLKDPVQYLTSILSMIIFPFIASPLFKVAFYNGNEAEFNNYLVNRKEFVIEYALKLLED